MIKLGLTFFGGRSSGGTRNTDTISSADFHNLSRTQPYSNQSNPIDDLLGSTLENAAKSWDSNIEPNYSREENTIYIGISNDPVKKYDLGTKAGNEFKKLMTERLESLGLSVEKSGKRKVEGLPEYWFRIKK